MNARRNGLALLLLLRAGSAVPPAFGGVLQDKAFSKPDLEIRTRNVDARTLVGDRSNPAEWARFFEAYGADTPVFMDPRSGTLTNMIVSVPLIPGTGVGNHLGLTAVDSTIVGALVRDFIVKNREVIGIEAAQLGTPIAAQVTDELWQVSIPQVVKGVRVRDGRIVATLSHGNLVLLGTEKWANVALDTQPGIEADAALDAAFECLGGRGCRDKLWKEPALEIVPFATEDGYGHRLVWTFGFKRADEIESWETLVDAKDGQVLALRDTNLHESKQISGGVYPLTSTEICPSSDRCGTIQPDWPMPFTDTGLPAPNDYTNAAGVYDFPANGSVTTTLNGRYVQIVDRCGAVRESSEAGDLDLGGSTGQHNCDSTGSAGSTAPARTTFYELNRIIEIARGWLPLNAWLRAKLLVELNQGLNNEPGGCSANYIPYSESLWFFSGNPGVCLNAAEVATVIDHEWGHGLDDHDAIGIMSYSSEAYGDIAAIYRQQVSCMYYGFKGGLNQGCGFTSDGTGRNRDESYVPGIVHCDLDCSGHRDADWDRHADHTPDTAQNFTCVACGGEVHCIARTVVQAAWDFASRDLQAPPFGLSRTNAFIVASKIFYQGSGNIGDWNAFNCSAGAPTSDGCGAANAYMQWLAADDDNGDLDDGTPHMTALHAAFDRHHVACDSPFPHDGGCTGGPVAAPVLVASAGLNRVDLSWSAVAGATRYRVLRTEGHAGCDMGEAVIAETAGLSYADTGLANGRAYHYVVQAVGSSGSCFGPGSACQSATPVQCAGTVAVPRHRFLCSDSLDITLEDSDLRGAGVHAVSVTSNSETAPETVVLAESPAGSGRFAGTLAIIPGSAASGDGSISVSDGDTITLRYLDASRCGALDVSYERTAQVDCRGPAITNVRVTNIGGAQAEIRWDTDEPADSRVVYGPTVPPSLAAPADDTLVTSHLVPLEGLEQCSDQYFAVSSRDQPGNQSLADNAGAFFTFETIAETKPVYLSPEPPMAIPPDDPWQGALAEIQVTDVEVVEDVNLEVTIAHPEDRKLALALIGPDHTTVVLSNRRGTDANYDNTRFDDQAAQSITSADSPFAGSFRPEQPLSAFTGRLATGAWTLRVTDDGSGYGTGTLEKFELELVYPPRVCGPSLGFDSRAFSDACAGSGAGAGNGIVEPGETLELSVQVTNADPGPATGVLARLTSYTPGVFVTSALSTYPDLAPGASAPSNVPFELYVDPSVPCGVPMVLRLDGSSNEGGWSTAFSLRTGDEVLVTTPYFNNTSKAIPDLSTIRSFLTVVDAWILEDVDVTLSISHPSPTDLDVFLVEPNGTRVELTTDNGGSFGSGYMDTVFDDEAALPITAGSGTFTGHFRPESPLSALDGKLATGTWTLEVTDDHQNVAGSLLRWSLALGHLVAPPCAVCPISEAPTEVASLAWSGTGKDTLVWGATPRATTYKLHRGIPSQLPALLDASVDSCERAAGSQLASGPVLTEDPSAGSFFWFVVRAENSVGAGSTGNATTGARVLNAGGACP